MSPWIVVSPGDSSSSLLGDTGRMSVPVDDDSRVAPSRLRGNETEGVLTEVTGKVLSSLAGIISGITFSPSRPGVFLRRFLKIW